MNRNDVAARYTPQSHCGLQKKQFNKPINQNSETIKEQHAPEIWG